jgi:hypothetical protein
MGRIIIGVIAVLGGLSGKLALRGTGSSTALVIVGAVFIVLGAIQMKKRNE